MKIVLSYTQNLLSYDGYNQFSQEATVCLAISKQTVLTSLKYSKE